MTVVSTFRTARVGSNPLKDPMPWAGFFMRREAATLRYYAALGSGESRREGAFDDLYREARRLTKGFSSARHGARGQDH